MIKALVFISIIALLSCSKSDTAKCEKWYYYDECVPKAANVFCNNPPTATYTVRSFCGDELRGAVPGASIIVTENSDRKTVRHFKNKAE